MLNVVRASWHSATASSSPWTLNVGAAINAAANPARSSLRRLCISAPSLATTTTTSTTTSTAAAGAAVAATTTTMTMSTLAATTARVSVPTASRLAVGASASAATATPLATTSSLLTRLVGPAPTVYRGFTTVGRLNSGGAATGAIRAPRKFTDVRFYATSRFQRGQRVTTQEREAMDQGFTEVDRRRDTRKAEEEDDRYYIQDYGHEGSQEGAITPDVAAYLSRVYSLLGATFLTTSAGSMLHMYTSLGTTVPGYVAGIGALVPLLGIVFTQGTTPTRLALLQIFGFLSGMAAAPLISASAAIDPGIVTSALMGTTAIFGGFTLVALKTRRGSTLKFGGPLIGGLFGLIAIQLGAMFLPVSAATSAALSSVYLYGGLGIFSAFISYDTQRMIESARAGYYDEVGDALQMFINLKNVFQFLMIIMGSRRD